MVYFDRCQHAGTRLVRDVGLLAFVALGACSHRPKPSTGPSTTPATEESLAARSARAAQSLDANELKADQFRSVEELIQGRFPGVQVTRLAGGGFSLRIRGASSFMSGQEPLYVLDGIALPQAPGGALLGLDPHDIERIEVLKDPSKTALYGMRGANGVILITTKSGR